MLHHKSGLHRGPKNKLLVFVDEKLSCALDHKTPCMMTFYTSSWG